MTIQGIKIKTKCIISDIDNVFADSREWDKHIPEMPSDRAGWNNFIKYSYLCKPNKELINTIQIGLPIIFITSREDTPELRKITENQL